MSIKLVSDAFSAEVGNYGMKLVLIKLADNANDEGTCWPSYKNMAKQCEMSERTVMRYMSNLIALGFVSKSSRIHDSRQTSNMYRLHIDSAARGDSVSPGGVTVSHPGGVSESPGGVSQCHPESSGKNRQENRHKESGNTTAAGAASGYPVEFENTWQKYPKREGGNPKARAVKAWRARLKAGADSADIEAGVERYAKYLRAKGKEGTQYVMQAATFFGPDEHWTQAWDAKPDNSSVCSLSDYMKDANGQEPRWLREAQ